jgi:polyhydroxyalkanoate synthase
MTTEGKSNTLCNNEIGVVTMFDYGEMFKASQKFWSEILSDPQKLTDLQANYWQEAVKFFEQPAETHQHDRRFQHEIWENNPFFQSLKQWYLFNTEQLKKIAILGSEEIHDKKSARKMRFMLEQWTNAASPANFVLTNPEVLKETLETGGENLKRGWENFLKDVSKSKKHFSISMTDLSAFEVGKNIAITPGKINYQNELMQLIQYSPTTEKVYKTPLLIVPPWINKYYILDLQAHNSFVKWIVDQGYTVFMISWVNPHQEQAEKDFSNYIQEGLLSALDVINKITEEEVNVLGFCIGGTLLACTLAYLAHRKEKRIKSATFLATLLDFADPGDIEVFIDEEQISALEKVMAKTGYLDGGHMSATFNLLRSNDLIWSYYVNHYLKGKSPVPFDVLYWNADATNMPHKMHSQYLRDMYLHNKLREPGGMTLCDVPMDLGKIKIPAYCLATQHDHIAPWQSVFASMQLLGGPHRFVLGESGHIVGIVNPPPGKKYGYRTNDISTNNPEVWLEKSKHHQDSWWNDWNHWLAQHSGEKIKSRIPRNSIEDAPGSYVKVRLGD